MISDDGSIYIAVHELSPATETGTYLHRRLPTL